MFYTSSIEQYLLSRLDKLDKTYGKSCGMLNMRFEGTDTARMILPEERDGAGEEGGEKKAEAFENAFKRVYKSEFGFLLEEKSIIVGDIKACISRLRDVYG